jgi:hypothetical protein
MSDFDADSFECHPIICSGPGRVMCCTCFGRYAIPGRDNKADPCTAVQEGDARMLLIATKARTNKSLFEKETSNLFPFTCQDDLNRMDHYFEV